MKKLLDLVVPIALSLVLGVPELLACDEMMEGIDEAAIQQGSGEIAVVPEDTPLAVPSAGEATDLAVTNDQGMFLGRVSDLIVNSDGRVDYIVIAKGDLYTLGEKLYAIPWQAANPRVLGNSLVVSISSEQIGAAPSFESWANFKDGDYENRVRAYYGRELAPEMWEAVPVELPTATLPYPCKLC